MKYKTYLFLLAMLLFPVTSSTSAHQDRWSLRIYDVLGREARDLGPGAASRAGRTDVVWNGTDNNGTTLNSGVYFVV